MFVVVLDFVCVYCRCCLDVSVIICCCFVCYDWCLFVFLVKMFSFFLDCVVCVYLPLAVLWFGLLIIGVVCLCCFVFNFACVVCLLLICWVNG